MLTAVAVVVLVNTETHTSKHPHTRTHTHSHTHTEGVGGVLTVLAECAAEARWTCTGAVVFIADAAVFAGRTALSAGRTPVALLTHWNKAGLQSRSATHTQYTLRMVTGS